MDQPTHVKPASYAFVLKLTDHPGGMEIIAATFAHRGVSLECSLGNDGALDPEGRATVIVTFSAPLPKKENLRRALGRLSRVRAIKEYRMDSPHLRKTVVFRVEGDREDFGFDAGEIRLEKIGGGEADDGSTYLVVDTPPKIDAFLERLRATGRLRDVATTVIGL